MWCATEARSLGCGGIQIVHNATNVACSTISRGVHQLRFATTAPSNKLRAKGGGRKPLVDTDPTLLADLDRLIEPVTRGDPESPLRWSSKSTTKLAQALRDQGHTVTQRTVHTLLDEQRYSMKSNRKVKEGGQNPDRDIQFHLISKQAIEFQSKDCPVISVDTKKKELIGEFKNAGKEWHQKGKNTDVNVHDFPDKKLGKAAPYGVYDITNNTGWVSVGVSCDTAEFAVESIRSWWLEMGQAAYPKADSIMITADCGGSNGNRVRLWKYELQKLADTIGKKITVHHLPPGTSKWNKIEHRMFSQISHNWRARPLIDLKTIVELIANTKTATGLTIKVRVDKKVYKTGIEVSDEEFKRIKIKPHKFHPEWNYTIAPRRNLRNTTTRKK